jgi:tripartite-type tricarboxylate transporter receptor subunit TctC
MRVKARRTLVSVARIGLLAQAPVAAEDFPSRPITIVVSLAAGSGMDTITRLYADKLSEALGKPVIVENKSGAATTLAANQIATARPDGYTLVVLTSIALSINPARSRSLRRKDFRYYRTCRPLPRRRAQRTTKAYRGTSSWCLRKRLNRLSTGFMLK